MDSYLDLLWWSDESNLLAGQSLLLALPAVSLNTDASSEGSGTSVPFHSMSSLGLPQERVLHFTLLKLRTLCLALYFQDLRWGGTVAVFSDNARALSYLLKQGGMHSPSLNAEAQAILTWAEVNSDTLLTLFVRESSDVVDDSFSRCSSVISTDWTLHQEILGNGTLKFHYPSANHVSSGSFHH